MFSDHLDFFYASYYLVRGSGDWTNATHGDILYDGAHVANLDKLKKMQNRSLRLVLKLNARTPVILVHQIAKISNLSVRRIAHLRNFMYKQQNNKDIINVRNVHTRAHDAVVFTNCVQKMKSIGIVSCTEVQLPGTTYP